MSSSNSDSSSRVMRIYCMLGMVLKALWELSSTPPVTSWRNTVTLSQRVRRQPWRCQGNLPGSRSGLGVCGLNTGTWLLLSNGTVILGELYPSAASLLTSIHAVLLIFLFLKLRKYICRMCLCRTEETAWRPAVSLL